MIIYLVVKVYEDHDFDGCFEPISSHKYRLNAHDMRDHVTKILESYPKENQFSNDDDFMDACHQWEQANPLIDKNIKKFEVRKIPMNTMFLLERS
jgi:hypothetical protein